MPTSLIPRGRGTVLALHEPWPAPKSGGGDAGGAEPPVLVLPALALPALAYAPALEALRRRRRVLFLDLRGQGASARAAESAGRDDGDASSPPCPLPFWTTLRDDVLAAIESIGAPTVDLVGHSLGAGAAALAAAAAPRRVRRAVLFEPPRYPLTLPVEATHRDLGADNAAFAGAAAEAEVSFPDADAARELLALVAPFRWFAPAARDAYVRKGLVAERDGSLVPAARPATVAAAARALLAPDGGPTDATYAGLPPGSVVAVGGPRKDVTAFLRAGAAAAAAAAASAGAGRRVDMPATRHYGPLEAPGEAGGVIAGALLIDAPRL